MRPELCYACGGYAVIPSCWTAWVCPCGRQHTKRPSISVETEAKVIQNGGQISRGSDSVISTAAPLTTAAYREAANG